LINALLPDPAFATDAVGTGDPPALRLYVNGTLLTQTAAVPPALQAASVSKYLPITAGVGDAGTLTFSVQADQGAGNDGGAPLMLTANPITVTAGMHYTVMAVGILDNGPTLIVAQEDFATPTCSQVVLRLVNADSDSVTPKQFNLDQSATPAATLAWFTVSADVVAPLSTQAVAVVANKLGPTGQAPFTLPPNTLAAGRSYFVIDTGEATRVVDDGRSQGLLIVPAGDDTPATWVKRDPLVYFVHASPPPTPSPLTIFEGANQLAINLQYASKLTYADLPPGTGVTLQFVGANGGATDGGVTDGGTSVVLDNQNTGPLVPGAIYLGGLVGMTGAAAPAQLKLNVWRIQPQLMGTLNNATPYATFINASATAPAVDFGYWGTDSTGAQVPPFVGVFTNVPYLSATPSSIFPAQNVAGMEWLGVQMAGTPSTNRAGSRTLRTVWYTAVLLGDWTSKDPLSMSQVAFYSNFGAIPTNPVFLPVPSP
jgi:hypothetical protein